jgi:hypothetical protein
MRQRTQVINALRAHLAELGITAAQGRDGIKELLEIIASDADERLPADAHASLVVLAAELQAMQTLIGLIEKRIMTQHRGDEASKRLRTIPGIGLIGATIAATVTDPKAFRSGRPISKQGDAICDAFSSWVRTLSCGVQSLTHRNIPGLRSSWRGGRSRSWRRRWPTKWRAWHGRCWPRVAHIGRLCSRQRPRRVLDSDDDLPAGSWLFETWCWPVAPVNNGPAARRKRISPIGVGSLVSASSTQAPNFLSSGTIEPSYMKMRPLYQPQLMQTEAVA